VAGHHARAVDLDARVAADAKHRAMLAGGGVDIGKTLEALRRAEKALEEVCRFAGRSAETHASELFRTRARYAAAQIGELARHLAELRASIRERDVMLRRSA
jgi:hypothetical protein